ncbi:GNAT family N-acetyltransferase [Paracrocinitomix mangrovi]|uniref:GNAT family N-acetyltransferase n=1 Tax=Paracrocinitomix mangrovi TaxID=2862509 RepID=UPI001C8D21AC|nr:GNAT family N-acetyltransferase [Paracrocinitomix mangrovi]UKN02123.1 GNAT family N-acetyltransferase [Paracrocinitomix mangrovi]
MPNKNLDYIIPPVDVSILKKELNQDRLVRKTNKGDNLVYIVNHHNSPNVMREIGRLRELTFTMAGGGTGEPLDIDEKDTAELCYEQLIVWDPEDEVITGGYRFFDCAKSISPDQHELSTSHYFNFSEKFIKEYLPHSIELGRSWVHPEYQPTKNPRKGLFALDNLWDGLGAIVHNYPKMKYFFGKVTMYTSYNDEAKRAVLGFMKHYFPDKEKLVWPKNAIYTDVEQHEINQLVAGLDFKEGIKVLQKYCREREENVPPLINVYMQLSPTMKSFGTAENMDFGGVEETGILITVDDIYESKKERHLQGLE